MLECYNQRHHLLWQMFVYIKTSAEFPALRGDDELLLSGEGAAQEYLNVLQKPRRPPSATDDDLHPK